MKLTASGKCSFHFGQANIVEDVNERFHYGLANIVEDVNEILFWSDVTLISFQILLANYHDSEEGSFK